MKVIKPQNITFFISICLLFMGTATIVYGQDPVFSQYDNNPAFLNAGKIGRFETKTAIFNQRFQTNLNTKYSTSQFTFVLPVYRMQNYTQKSAVNHLGGVGFTFLNDVSDGSFKTTSVSINWAYNWKLDPKMLHMVSFGLSTGFMKLAVDMNNFTWGEQYGENGFDPNYVPGSIPDEDRATVFDVGFGTYWTYVNKYLELSGIRNIDAGISFGHLNSPNISTVSNNEAKLPVLIKMHSSFFYALNEQYFVGARLLYLHQNQNKRLNIGGTFGVNFENSSDYISSVGKKNFGFTVKEVYLDVWFNTNNSLGAALNFDFTSAKAGFSFEPNYSAFSVTNKVGSAYELFLQVNIPDKLR